MKLKTLICISLSFLIFSCAVDETDNLIENETTEVNVSNRSADFLDYGVYWFNSQNQSAKAFDERTNRKINVSSSFYDPSKPTVVYFHGWQNNTSRDNYRRETFQFVDASNNVNVNTAQIWKNKGWNVAIFYWNQFADEGELKDAEAKIWSTNGNRKMRYRLSDGSYSERQAPTNSLGIEAFNQLSALLANNTSNNIRFVGHSLGNQLATYTSFLFSTAVKKGNLSARLMPNRLELLDPFWSKGRKNYLGDYNNDGSNDWTGERVRWYVQEMKNRNNLATTWYSSSLILNAGIGDSNNRLKDIAAFQSVRYWYVSAIDVVAKHVNARHSYFWGLNFDAPAEVRVNWLLQRTKTGRVAASASTSTSRIRQMMGSANLWDQVEGRYTATPEDDMFQIK